MSNQSVRDVQDRYVFSLITEISRLTLHVGKLVVSLVVSIDIMGIRGNSSLLGGRVQKDYNT